MQAVIDQAGRIVIPKALRDGLGLQPGSTVDISAYGAGVLVIPGGRTARLAEEDGVLVAVSDDDTVLTDEIMYALLDAGRK